MSNQPCLTKPTVTDLNNDELRCYPFVVSLYRCSGVTERVHWVQSHHPWKKTALFKEI